MYSRSALRCRSGLALEQPKHTGVERGGCRHGGNRAKSGCGQRTGHAGNAENVLQNLRRGNSVAAVAEQQLGKEGSPEGVSLAVCVQRVDLIRVLPEKNAVSAYG